MIWLISIWALLWAGVYVHNEMRICRKGGDVYEWTKKLVAALAAKESKQC